MNSPFLAGTFCLRERPRNFPASRADTAVSVAGLYRTARVRARVRRLGNEVDRAERTKLFLPKSCPSFSFSLSSRPRLLARCLDGRTDGRTDGKCSANEARKKEVGEEEDDDEEIKRVIKIAPPPLDKSSRSNSMSSEFPRSLIMTSRSPPARIWLQLAHEQQAREGLFIHSDRPKARFRGRRQAERRQRPRARSPSDGLFPPPPSLCETNERSYSEPGST